MKLHGSQGDVPPLVTEFLRLVGVEAVLSIVECLGESGAFEPLFDSLLGSESPVGIPAAGH